MAASRQANGMYPIDAHIHEMGLDAAEAAMLTDNAKKLTKRELIILQNTTNQYRSQGETKVLQVFDERTGLHLNLGDVTSIAHAFTDAAKRRNAAPAAAAADACCCCTCCPCCSCTASVVISATR